MQIYLYFWKRYGCALNNRHQIRMTCHIRKVGITVAPPEVPDTLTNRFLNALNKYSLQIVFRINRSSFKRLCTQLLSVLRRLHPFGLT